MKHPMITHDQWGMPPMKNNHASRRVADIDEGNIHHSDSVPPADHHDCAEQVRNIDTYHRSKGWACIGYNRTICSHGYVYQGRQIVIVPAAAEGHNQHIIAYCLLAKGNNPATVAQLQALWDTIRQDERRINRVLRLTTHREVEPVGYTECPGDGIEKQVRKRRESLKTKGN